MKNSLIILEWKARSETSGNFVENIISCYATAKESQLQGNEIKLNGISSAKEILS